MPETTPSAQAPTAPAGAAAGAPVAQPNPAAPAAAPTVPVTPPSLEGTKPEKPTVLGGEGAQPTPEEKAAQEKAAKEAAKAERQKNMTPEQKAADDAREVAEEKAKTVPVDGKYSYTLPEGTTLPKEIKEKLDGFLKDSKLTNGQAQQMADIGAELMKKQMETTTQGYIDAWKAQVAKNEETIKNHPDYGGAKFEESKAAAQRAIRAYATPALIKKLDDGLGNDPDFFEFCLKAGRRLSEAGAVQASPDNGTPQRAEDKWFGQAVQAIEQLNKQNQIT